MKFEFRIPVFFYLPKIQNSLFNIHIAPLVSAIVLNYKSPRDAVSCVQALEKQTIADKLEIFVVDNHSEDESIGVIRNRLTELPHVRILESNANVGYGRGNEIGMRRAAGTYILIINPDNELLPESLEKMVAQMEKHPDIGIIAPKLMHDDGTVRDAARAFPSFLDVVIKRMAATLFPKRMDRYLQRDIDPDKERDIDWVVGACVLIRRELIEKIGGFDPRFFLFFEDMDLCRRAWNAGFRVHYLPSAVARDRKHRLSEGGFLTVLLHKTGRIHIKSAFQYFWKWRKGVCNKNVG
ncbi:MAG TPA: glycosyltransferase family 2 protein [Candidatus Peribacteraceae bacterium]|nr:glycosyltransferase family 2 protein [Candidatus Peribacteraceae bacterium]